jgi:hypothetical protein
MEGIFEIRSFHDETYSEDIRFQNSKYTVLCLDPKLQINKLLKLYGRYPETLNF